MAGSPQQGQTHESHRYKLIDLGTFGGPASNMNLLGNGAPYISPHGVAVGTSATSVPSGPTANGFVCNGLDGTVPFVFHAFEWKDDSVRDLGALPPAFSNCSSALAVNSSGLMAGASENGSVDPVNGVNQIRAVVWKDGEIEVPDDFPFWNNSAWYSRMCRGPKRSGEQWKCRANSSTVRI